MGWPKRLAKPVEAKCEICSKPIQGNFSTMRKYCSVECQHASQVKKGNTVGPKPCGKPAHALIASAIRSNVDKRGLTKWEAAAAVDVSVEQMRVLMSGNCTYKLDDIRKLVDTGFLTIEELGTAVSL